MSQYDELSEFTKRLAQLCDETNTNLKPIMESMSSIKGILDEYISPLRDSISNIYSPQLKELQDKLVNSLSDITEKYRPIWNQFDEDNKLSREQLVKKYKTRFYSNFSLGEAGWVASAFGNASDYKEWINMINKNAESEIINSFEGWIDSLLDELQAYYKDYDKKIYFDKAVSYFNSNDYMTCVLYLLPLLNNRVDTLFDFGNLKKYNRKFTLNGFELMMEKEFQNNQQSIARKYFLILDMYPSLCGYLNRLFVNQEYPFEKNIEPPHLNRNWLLHGYSKRNITRKDCIQLLNALHTVEFVNEWTNVCYIDN